MKPWIRHNYTPERKGWKQEYTLSVSKTSGGLNNVTPENLIEDVECVDCKNMRFAFKSIMEKRPGIAQFKPESYPEIDEEITWLDIFRPSIKDPMLIRGTATKLYINDKEVCTVKQSIHGVTFMNRYFFVDGQYLRYYDPDKDKVYRVVEEPIVHTAKEYQSSTKDPLTITSFEVDTIPEMVKVGDGLFILGVSAGSDSNFKTTIKSIDKEKKIIEINDLFTVPASNKVIKNSPIFLYNPLNKTYPQGEVKYDDDKGIAYYLPCENELEDGVAGESYIPDAPDLITVHNSRLFIAGDTTQPHGVYMSRTSQPLYFPSNAALSVNPTGEKIVDMFTFDTALVIGRHSDMFALYGNSEYSESDNPYRISQMDVSSGLISNRCGAILNNYYIFLGYDGRFYKLSTPTTYVDYIMTKPLGYKVDIYKNPFNVKQNESIEIDTVSYRNEIYFSINNKFVIVYNYDCMAFTYFVGWDASVLRVYDNHLLIGSNTGKLYYYMDDTEIFNDDGKPIECTYISKRFEPYGNTVFKYFKQFMVTAYAYDESLSNIDATVICDNISHHLTNPIPSNLSRFDSAFWNMNVFDSYNLFKSWYYQINIRARTIQYIFKCNALDEGMRIYDFNTIYTMRDIR